jgi:hypothetical protein
MSPGPNSLAASHAAIRRHSRLEHRHALRQKAADHAGQHVAGTGSGKRRRTVVCNRRTTTWLSHHAVGSLQNQNGAPFS